MFLTGTEI
eukprot:gene5786-7984_t